ncbi:MAG: PIN domain-containing protein [Verrucomicrobia bacterium]|nr:PIN domain-containing protein [Verrucomicrobiota bacterium]
MIHFDTNYLIQATVPGSPAHVHFAAWAEEGETFGVSTVAWPEYLCGPLDPQGEALARQMFPHPEPLLLADAEEAADLFNRTGRRSRSLADCMIAAVALRCGAKLATINTADFTPFQPHGLILA